MIVGENEEMERRRGRGQGTQGHRDHGHHSWTFTASEAVKIALPRNIRWMFGVPAVGGLIEPKRLHPMRPLLPAKEE